MPPVSNPLWRDDSHCKESGWYKKVTVVYIDYTIDGWCKYKELMPWSQVLCRAVGTGPATATAGPILQAKKPTQHSAGSSISTKTIKNHP